MLECCARTILRSVGMQRARSVTGPLRRAHPASGATWNVQVVRGKMSSRCLWHACRALAAGLLLMLLGAAMATIGYYADQLSVAQEIRGNATVSVKDEARGFHLNNLSYAGPIVMGFGGFIVVAACVMTFEARDSAAKVTPARPQAPPRPVPRRPATGVGAARWDQLGVYRLPALPLPLPHTHPHPHRRTHTRIRTSGTGTQASGKHVHGSAAARFGSAPDLRTPARAALSVSALRRPLRRYALSVDEAPQCAHSASAAESECGSQTSLALDLHVGAGAGGSAGSAGVTLRVRDNTRRRPLARQPRVRDDVQQATREVKVSTSRRSSSLLDGSCDITETEIEDVRPLRACSAPPRTLSASSDTSTVPVQAPRTPSPIPFTQVDLEMGVLPDEDVIGDIQEELEETEDDDGELNACMDVNQTVDNSANSDTQLTVDEAHTNIDKSDEQ